MNRFLLYIHWIDAKVVYNTLTSIQNALQYSKIPTEILLILNEQTFVDTPLIGNPSDMWNEFLHHPLISQCKTEKKTNVDSFCGVAQVRRDYLNSDGLTYWGEADCLLPLEYFYISEEIYNTQNKPFVLTFAIRKMWEGWESIEHPFVKNKTLSDLPKGDFWRVDSPLTLEKIYEVNENSGEPNIILLSKPRIEGALTVLSNYLPTPLIAPNIDFFHEDFCLELAMPYYGIPQYHVSNILKGHDNGNPNKRANIFNKDRREDNNIAKEKKEMCYKNMIEFIKNLYDGKYKK